MESERWFDPEIAKLAFLPVMWWGLKFCGMVSSGVVWFNGVWWGLKRCGGV